MTMWMRGAWVVVLVGVLSGTAFAQVPEPDVSKPPPDLADYFEQVRKAEAIKDAAQRCLAYPDLPGNQWPEGAAAARCAYLAQEVGFSLDELQAMLNEADGAVRLEAQMQALLEAHYREPHQRDRIFKVLERFDGGVAAGSVAVAWLRKAPRSPFAMTAMGSHRARQGWKARGGAWAANTSAPQLQRMNQEFAGAIPLLVEALELEPRLTPACLELTGIGRMSSDGLQQHSLARCLQVDPLSYALVWEWMMSAMPKWGGSLEDMAVVAAYARKHGPQNPMLYSLLAEPPGYPATRAKTYAEGKAGFVAASRAAPGAAMMRDAGHAFRAEDEDPWVAIMYWSQALRFWPDSAAIRSARGNYLYEIGQFELALRDLLPAVEASPEDIALHYTVGASLTRLERLSEARPHLKRALRLKDFETAALEFYCYTFLGSPGGSTSPEAQDCTARLVNAEPTRGLFWSWRYQVLMDVQDEGWEAAATQFIRHADRANPEQMSRRKELLDNGVAP